MAELRLRDKEYLPTDEVIKEIIGDSFEAFSEFHTKLAENGITPEWNYYRDGNAWLCKLLFKKKNLGWLHVYDGCFNVTTYFPVRHMEKIEAELDVSKEIMQTFLQSKPSGKTMGMHVSANTKDLPEDIIKMLLFKAKLK